MGKLAGEVSVRMTEESAAAVADWISMTYLPSYRAGSAGLLANRKDERAALRLLSDLSIRLEEIGRRKPRKRGVFLRPLKRTAVMALLLATGYRKATMFGQEKTMPFAHGPFLQALEWMDVAVKGAGRRALSANELRERVAGRIHVVERHMGRLIDRQKTQEKWVEFLRAGGSLLGSSVPLPDK
jgi:hypothetical protein